MSDERPCVLGFADFFCEGVKCLGGERIELFPCGVREGSDESDTIIHSLEFSFRENESPDLSASIDSDKTHSFISLWEKVASILEPSYACAHVSEGLNIVYHTSYIIVKSYGYD